MPKASFRAQLASERARNYDALTEIEIKLVFSAWDYIFDLLSYNTKVGLLYSNRSSFGKRLFEKIQK
jgi:hypothetical protein